MILAGIDEAGYGPRLGPLVVAASAFRADGNDAGPDGWPRCLFQCRGTRFRVGDSKALYSTAAGVGALEPVVLGMAEALVARPASLSALLDGFAAEGVQAALKQPWYSWRDTSLPVAAREEDLDEFRGAVGQGLADAGLEFLWTRFCVVDEARYNELLLRTGNKAMVLFGRNGVLLRGLWDEFAREGLYVTADRHGGRKFYAGLLDIVFPDCRIHAQVETDRESAYSVESADGRRMSVRFLVRAEETDSAVALSSMWAKYVRELFMSLFNDYWLARARDVRPTAGYWVDGERFVAQLRAAGVVSDEEADRFVRWK